MVWGRGIRTWSRARQLPQRIFISFSMRVKTGQTRRIGQFGRKGSRLVVVRCGSFRNSVISPGFAYLVDRKAVNGLLHSSGL
jgi:hypothetical protein